MLPSSDLEHRPSDDPKGEPFQVSAISPMDPRIVMRNHRHKVSCFVANESLEFSEVRCAFGDLLSSRS